MEQSITHNPVNNVERRLATRRSRLRPAELQAARYFVDSPEDVAFLPAAELARKLGVSDATVIRAAQALGYSGFAELKRELIETVRTRMNPSWRAARSLEGVSDDPLDVLDQVLDVQIASLEDARATLARADFEHAIDVLGRASRVHIVGFGPPGVLAEYMRMRLTRIGRDASTATQAGFLLAESLLGIRGGDALVLIAHGTYTVEIETALAHCQAMGVPVVLLSNLSGAVPEKGIEVCLLIRRNSAGLLHSPASTLVLMDALVLGLAVQDRSRTLGSLGAVQDLRRSIAQRQTSRSGAGEPRGGSRADVMPGAGVRDRPAEIAGG